jgi:hypothetical protein
MIWTKQEDEILRQSYPLHGIRFAMKALAESGNERTRSQVKNRVQKMGLKSTAPRKMRPDHPWWQDGRMTKWPLEAEAILIEHYEKNGGNFCYHLLVAMGFDCAKNVKQVAQKGRKMGLRYLGESKSRFKPGHIPKNKGKKLSYSDYQKLEPYMFKKGDYRHNTVPVGTETNSQKGYWRIKIAQPNVWAFKHRYIWQQAGREIPPGHILVFIDGNPNHCTLDNLECIPRSAHCIRNRHLVGAQTYSLEVGRAAKESLKKKGLSNKDIRENPELLEFKKQEIKLKSQLKSIKNATQSSI